MLFGPHSIMFYRNVCTTVFFPDKCLKKKKGKCLKVYYFYLVNFIFLSSSFPNDLLLKLEMTLSLPSLPLI